MSEDFSFGLDISSFSPEKKKVLYEYIAIFEKLNKYNGLKINPITGSGLSAFNTSLKQTSTLLDDINAKMFSLNSLKASPIINYGNAVQATGRKVREFKKDAEDTSGTLEGIGKNLTRTLSLLRVIAYILPGIGIAGIFNLAFTAIGEVLEGMELFHTSLKNIAEREKAINNDLKEQVSLFREVYKIVKDISELSPYGDRKTKELLDEAKTRGVAKDVLLPQELSLSKKLADDATKEMKVAFGSELQINGILLKRKEELGVAARKLTELNKEELRINSQKLTIGTGDVFKDYAIRKGIEEAKETLKAQKEAAQSEFNLAKEKFEVLKDVATEYYAKTHNFREKQAELEKFTSDESRKLALETAKSNIAVKQAENQDILKDERSTYEERVAAIADNYKREVELNLAAHKNIKDNNSTTAKEQQIADTELLNNNTKAFMKMNEEIEKTTIEFYQRLIKAKAEMSQDDVEREAIANERIFKNETKSLQDRLVAYTLYIVGKQKLNDIQLERDLQKGADSATGKTALTREEAAALSKTSTSLNFNIQADAEKQIYDIVSSSLKKRLALVKTENILEEEANNAAYTKALKNLNDSFEAKKISYFEYNKARLAIDKKYRIQYLDAQIKDDNEEIDKIKKLLDEEKKLYKQAQDDLDTDNVLLLDARNSGRSTLKPQRAYDESLGRSNAARDQIDETSKELKRKQAELDHHELERQRERIANTKAVEDEEARHKIELISAIQEAETAAYEAITNIADRSYDYRIAKIEELNAAAMKQYDNQMAAIEASSLSEKEKNALSIQLMAQKDEKERESAAEVKRLRREQAIFDRDASIAQIIVSTALAVIKAFTEGDPYTKTVRAALAGVVGAAALATAISTPIPSYEEGTDWHPGGLARTGEKGKPELIKEPYKSPYLVLSENISYLPRGTEVIPIKESPVFGELNTGNDGWAQVMYLANRLKPKQNKTVNNINIDLGFELYKKQILGN